MIKFLKPTTKWELCNINAADPGYTATNFNKHSGTIDVVTAATHVIQYAMLNDDGPTGQFFSWDNDPVNGISPW